MIEWKATQLAWTRKFATMSLHFDWAEKKMDRWNWGEVSQHEFKGVERRRERERWKESWGESRRCAQKWESLKRDDERWEVVGRVEMWFHNLQQEVRSPGKEHGSLPQLLYANPVFGSYSVTLLKPGNFRHPPCAGSTCNVFFCCFLSSTHLALCAKIAL